MDKKSAPSKRLLRKEIMVESDRQDILDTASRLFAAQGIDQTSMSDIADQSGFSVGKIYKFFPSKKSLFLHIVGAFLDRLNICRSKIILTCRKATKAHALHISTRSRIFHSRFNFRLELFFSTVR